MTENTKELNIFEKLCEIDCSKYIEKKNGLSYLSWTYAWKEFKKVYSDAVYEITHWDGRPYLFDPDLGYMVETTITAGGETRSMWLPVMNSANKAMKNLPYQIKTSSGKVLNVEAATMFDINTSIMRCLVKNIAMFGLGLYIYAGEDIPELSDVTKAEKQAEEQTKKIQAMKDRIAELLNKIDPSVDVSKFAKYKDSNSIEELTAIGIELKRKCDTQGAN